MKEIKKFLNEYDKEENILTPISRRLVKKGVKLLTYGLRTKINCDKSDENYEPILYRNYRYMQETLIFHQQRMLINELNSIDYTYDNFNIDFIYNNFGLYPDEYHLLISSVMALKLSCYSMNGRFYINHSPFNGWKDIKNKIYNPNSYGLPEKYFGFNLFVLNLPQENQIGNFEDWNTDTLYFIHKDAITEYRDKKGWDPSQNENYQYLELKTNLDFNKNLIKKIRPILK